MATSSLILNDGCPTPYQPGITTMTVGMTFAEHSPDEPSGSDPCYDPGDPDDDGSTTQLQLTYDIAASGTWAVPFALTKDCCNCPTFAGDSAGFIPVPSGLLSGSISYEQTCATLDCTPPDDVNDCVGGGYPIIYTGTTDLGAITYEINKDPSTGECRIQFSIGVTPTYGGPTPTLGLTTDWILLPALAGAHTTTATITTTHPYGNYTRTLTFTLTFA